MTLSRVEHPRLGKPNAGSDISHSQSQSCIRNPKCPGLQPSKSPSRNGSSEARQPLIRKNPQKMVLLARLRGLGCKGPSTRVSESTIIRSAADWETDKRRRKNQGNKLPTRARVPDNVAVDIPDICCAPPG